MSQPLDGQDWLDVHGRPIGCTGKLRVLRENEAELRQVMGDACADALLMEVAPQVLRRRMTWLLEEVLEGAGCGRDDRPAASGGEE